MLLYSGYWVARYLGALDHLTALETQATLVGLSLVTGLLAGALGFVCLAIIPITADLVPLECLREAPDLVACEIRERAEVLESIVVSAIGIGLGWRAPVILGALRVAKGLKTHESDA
jgi:hypothetical protein